MTNTVYLGHVYIEPRELQAITEAYSKEQSAYLEEEKARKRMGKSTRDHNSKSKGRRSIQVLPLQKTVPKKRDIMRPLPVHKGKSPRPEVRAYELGRELRFLPEIRQSKP